MVIDAIMVCFCEDCRANDGSEERPYYMSNSLKVIFLFLSNLWFNFKFSFEF